MPAEPIRCVRCGDEDGPFTGTGADALCEPCALPLPLPLPLTQPTP